MAHPRTPSSSKSGLDQRLYSSSDRKKTTQLKSLSLSTITDLELKHV